MAYRLTKSWPDAHMQRLAVWTRDMMDGAGPTAALIGCSSEAIVAQAALESAWGASAIGNNLFGIKADASWKGARRTVRTREVYNGQNVMVDDVFRDYPNFAASIADHFAFLKNNSRYEKAGVFNAGSDQAYFEALQRAGYATDPHYAASLMNMLASVKMFTACMVDDSIPQEAATAPPPGYVTTSTGNVIRADIGQSSIVKGADAGVLATKIATGAAAVGAPAAAVAGMDWKVMLALAAVVLAGVLAFAVWKLLEIKTARLDMHEKGIA